MIIVKKCIWVVSDINTWIDFCILTENDVEKAKLIVETAYDEWFESTNCETIADYIGTKLYENGIEFEMYFKNESEDEEDV